MAARPLAARAQQSERMRRIGVLTGAGGEDDLDQKTRLAALFAGLQELGWVDGRNLRIDVRWSTGNMDRTRKYAAELVALAPDVLVAGGTSTVLPLQQASGTVPIVFVGALDPVGAGFIDTLARPAGNTTGFMQSEYGLTAKWVELLKQIAPDVKRAAVLRNPTDVSGAGQFAVIQYVASSVGLEISSVSLRDAKEIERAVEAFAQTGNGGLIATAGGLAVIHRELIIALAARHKLPAIYPRRLFVADGGLLAYGADRVEQSRLAAAYVNRILRGEKPADLPVQAPTKYELVINLKTANTLGLTVPSSLLARADEVIE